MKRLYRNSRLDKTLLICGILLLAFGSIGFGLKTHKSVAESAFNILPDDIKGNLSLAIIKAFSVAPDKLRNEEDVNIDITRADGSTVNITAKKKDDGTYVLKIAVNGETRRIKLKLSDDHQPASAKKQATIFLQLAKDAYANGEYELASAYLGIASHFTADAVAHSNSEDIEKDANVQIQNGYTPVVDRTSTGSYHTYLNGLKPTNSGEAALNNAATATAMAFNNAVGIFTGSGENKIILADYGDSGLDLGNTSAKKTFNSGYKFNLETAGEVLITIDAAAFKNNGDSSDDDLVVVIDGVSYGWNNITSFDGNTLDGRGMVSIKANLSEGEHTISFIVDNNPILYSISVTAAVPNTGSPLKLLPALNEHEQPRVIKVPQQPPAEISNIVSTKEPVGTDSQPIETLVATVPGDTGGYRNAGTLTPNITNISSEYKNTRLLEEAHEKFMERKMRLKALDTEGNKTDGVRFVGTPLGLNSSGGIRLR